MSVTLRKSDWSGEHVNVQNRLKKLSLQAGHEDMMDSARFKFVVKASSYKSPSVDVLLDAIRFLGKIPDHYDSTLAPHSIFHRKC